MKDLIVTLIQEDIRWEDVDKNLAILDTRLSQIQEKTHIVVLPEMFSTGFTMNAKALAQDMNGQVVNWLREKADQREAYILGSLIVLEEGQYFNRLVCASPDGNLYKYDKRHLLEIYGETDVYSPGAEILTFDLNGWKIRPFICFDLRFPIWSRNLVHAYDVGIYIANWPNLRAEHWNILLRARAIENQCWIIGVNRIGSDANGYSYDGDSSIIDPEGNMIFKNHGQPCIHTARLSIRPLRMFRDKFPAWRHADADMLRDNAGRFYPFPNRPVKTEE